MFKVGDKVKIPKTKPAYYNEFMRELKQSDYRKDFLYIISVTDNTCRLGMSPGINLGYDVFDTDKLELYKEEINNNYEIY